MNKIRSNPIIRKILIWRKAWNWTRYFLSNSGVFLSGYDVDVYRARMRKDAHTIEKGLSLPSVRANFGQGKISELAKDIQVAQKDEGLAGDMQIAADVLGSYVKWHQENGHSNPFVANLDLKVASHGVANRHGGTTSYKSVITQQMKEHFDAVVTSRRSVRNFSPERIDLSDVEDAVRVAWSSPSVCNRQPWSIALAQSPEMINALLRLQAGNRGFEQTISNLIVVMADTKAFVEDYEIFEPFVDAGIFSGALVNALHARNIESCCLNLCVSHHIAERIIKVLDVPVHLFPVMMIACGRASEECKVAMSTRGPSVVLRR